MINATLIKPPDRIKNGYSFWYQVTCPMCKGEFSVACISEYAFVYGETGNSVTCPCCRKEFKLVVEGDCEF
jgi:hypothetical protein